MHSSNIKTLKLLVSNPLACVRKVEKSITILVYPEFFANIQEGVKTELNFILNKYSQELGGFLLGYTNVRVLSNKALVYDTFPYMHVSIHASFYVFAPNTGDIVEGVVVKKSPHHIGCLVHDVFNMSCFIPSGVNREDWYGRMAKEGDKIKIKVTDVDVKSYVPHFKGTLEAESIRSQPHNSRIVFNDDDDDDSGISSCDRSQEEVSQVKGHNFGTDELRRPQSMKVNANEQDELSGSDVASQVKLNKILSKKRKSKGCVEKSQYMKAEPLTSDASGSNLDICSDSVRESRKSKKKKNVEEGDVHSNAKIMKDEIVTSHKEGDRMYRDRCRDTSIDSTYSKKKKKKKNVWAGDVDSSATIIKDELLISVPDRCDGSSSEMTKSKKKKKGDVSATTIIKDESVISIKEADRLDQGRCDGTSSEMTSKKKKKKNKNVEEHYVDLAEAKTIKNESEILSYKDNRLYADSSSATGTEVTNKYKKNKIVLKEEDDMTFKDEFEAFCNNEYDVLDLHRSSTMESERTKHKKNKKSKTRGVEDRTINISDVDLLQVKVEPMTLSYEQQCIGAREKVGKKRKLLRLREEEGTLEEFSPRKKKKVKVEYW